MWCWRSLPIEIVRVVARLALEDEIAGDSCCILAHTFSPYPLPDLPARLVVPGYQTSSLVVRRGQSGSVSSLGSLLRAQLQWPWRRVGWVVLAGLEGHKGRTGCQVHGEELPPGIYICWFCPNVQGRAVWSATVGGYIWGLWSKVSGSHDPIPLIYVLTLFWRVIISRWVVIMLLWKVTFSANY